MKKVTENELDNALNSAEKVILDFSSPGCAPCKRMPALLEEVLTELADSDIKAYEVNVAEEPDLARKFFVLGVPTLILFRSGKEFLRLSSVPKKSKLIKALSK